MEQGKIVCENCGEVHTFDINPNGSYDFQTICQCGSKLTATSSFEELDETEMAEEIDE